MKFSIITLFPNLIDNYIQESIMKRAVEKEQLEVEILDLRQYSNLRHNQVDDYQVGGGKGMVLMCEPIVNAIESIKTKESFIVLTSPQGVVWNQTIARVWKKSYNHIILICGHYEGFDERILAYVDCEVSIGDYIMTGGELASLVIVDSIARVLPGVIKDESHLNDSFENNLLDHAVYTKPNIFRNVEVPEVLLSGHHGKIEEYRKRSQVLNTYNKRPDLLEKANLSKDQIIYLEELKKVKGE